MVPDDTAAVAYQAANRLFAKEIALHVSDDDSIWIHDYHLMLLPQFLRQELGDTKKQRQNRFFLHTPFPVAMTSQSCRLRLDQEALE
jgi:trehalose 6-phosphate synthase